MKLNAKEFKRFKELSVKQKNKTLTGAEEAELAELTAKKNEKGSNDLAWWARYTDLLKDVVKLPFNFIQGMSYELRDPHNTGLSTYFGSVARVGYIPTIGLSRSESDPFNAQMRQLWLDMHRKYRGIGSYQRSDLGIMILAIANLFGSISKFERIYGVINTYRILNRNIPYTLFEALGIDPTIADNLADFRYNLNYRIAKLQQLCLPKGIAAIEAEMVNNLFIFKDSEDPRSALFLFDPDVFGIYDPTTLSSGGCVKYQTFESIMVGFTPQNRPGFTAGSIYNVLDTQINALLADDDVAKMCSDLLAAYGPENVMTIAPIPEDLTINPVFDYERKLQFHNLQLCGDINSIYDFEVDETSANAFKGNGVPIIIYQHNDIILNRLSCVANSLSLNYHTNTSGVVICAGGSDPYSSNGCAGKAHDILLDTWVDNPGDMEVMCGTRMSAICDDVASFATSGGNTYYYQPLSAFGTVVCTKLQVYTRHTTGGITYTLLDQSQTTDTYMIGKLEGMCNLQQLDWHPLFYVAVGGGRQGLVGDIDNCTKLDDDMLSKIHDVALYSAFRIPNVAYIQ